MFGLTEIAVWIILVLIIVPAGIYVFYRFTGRGKKGEVARREGVRHEGVHYD